MRIELNCAECGGNRFTIIEGMRHDAIVLCAECGHRVGTMADLKDRVADEVLNAARNDASRALIDFNSRSRRTR